MAYRNANGEVTIDEAAANADILKIRGAIEKLNDSQSSLNQLNSAASSMQGMTGAAISEQCMKLGSRITELKNNLEFTIQYIRKTVVRYKEEDQQLAQKIKSGGGV